MMNQTQIWEFNNKLDTDVITKYMPKITEDLHMNTMDAELDVLQRTVDFLRGVAESRKAHLNKVKYW